MQEEKTDLIDGEIEYRPLNIMAVGGFLLSFTSLLTVINIGLVILPLLAIALALVGYLQVKRGERPMVGERLALCGIVIAVFISSLAITYQIARENHMYNLAQKYTEKWFELIQDEDFYRAHQLTIQPEARVNVDSDDHLKAYYDEQFVLVRPRGEAPVRPFEGLKSLLGYDPVFSLFKLGDRAKIRYLRRDRKLYFKEFDREIFSLIYEISPSVHTPNEPMVFSLMVERRVFEEPIGVQWRITQRKYISGGPPKKLEISQ